MERKSIFGVHLLSGGGAALTLLPLKAKALRFEVISHFAHLYRIPISEVSDSQLTCIIALIHTVGWLIVLGLQGYSCEL